MAQVSALFQISFPSLTAKSSLQTSLLGKPAVAPGLGSLKAGLQRNYFAPLLSAGALSVNTPMRRNLS